MQNKTLTFTSQGLAETTRLFLIFDDGLVANDNGTYSDKFPVVWRLQQFGPGANVPEPLTVTFSNQLAWFTHGMGGNNTIQGLSNATPVTYDRQTTLRQGGLPFIPSETDTMTLVNDTGGVKNVALGFFSVDQGQPTPVPVYRWPLGAAQTIRTNFRPVLRVYVYVNGPNYRQNMIIMDEIARPARLGGPIRTLDLTALGDNTNWVLATNAAGQFVINEV